MYICAYIEVIVKAFFTTLILLNNTKQFGYLDEIKFTIFSIILRGRPFE